MLAEYLDLLPTSVQEMIEVLMRNPLYVSYATTLLSAITIAFLYKAARQIPFLDPKEFKPIKLIDKKFINHNTMWMRFALSTKQQRLGLPIGQHMSFLAKDENGKDIYRSYTPVSDDDQRGFVDFVIKVYPEGKMSQALKRLEVGQYIQVKGPKVCFKGMQLRVCILMHTPMHAHTSMIAMQPFMSSYPAAGLCSLP